MALHLKNQSLLSNAPFLHLRKKIQTYEQNLIGLLQITFIEEISLNVSSSSSFQFHNKINN